MQTARQPVIYLRVAHGGRLAAQTQEAEVRRALQELSIDHNPMHVSCDIDVPGTSVGAALALLMEEARYGQVRTVIVQDVARLGSTHAVLVSVLTLIEGVGVEVVSTDSLRYDPDACARLSRRTGRRSHVSGLLTLGFGAIDASAGGR